MISALRKFLRKRTIAFQIQFVLGVTTLIFWHFYTAFELVSQIRRDLRAFDSAVSSQLHQFIADNQASMQLFDYERVRENAGRLTFRYPTRTLFVTGQYGDMIYERGTPLDGQPLFRQALPFGELQISKELDNVFRFSLPLVGDTPSDAVVSGVLDLNPMVRAVLSELSNHYIFGMSLFLFQVLLIAFCARLATKPLELFARRLRTDVGELPLDDGRFHRSSEMKDLITSYNDGIRARRELQARLVEAERKAGQAKLAAQVAHDLASPLGSLKVAMEYFGTLKNSEPHFSMSYNLLSLSAKRLEEIAGVLLKDYQAGENSDEEIVSVHRVLDELIGEFQARNGTVTYEKAYCPSTLYIRGARGKLKRAFGNIIKNAIEAMAGKGTLTCTTSRIGFDVRISFGDTGHGISPENIDKLGVENFTHGKKGGHGLGLSVVREVMAESHGRMSVESDVGKGTTFTFHFPEASPNQEESSGAAMDSILIPARRDEPIIVVEDDPVFRSRWEEIIKNNDHNVIFFDSYEAVKASTLSGTDSQTAIVDFNFASSTRSGFDVIRLLKERGVKHFTLCTGDYWKPDIQREARSQGLPVCPKPLPDVRFELMEGA